METIQRFEPSTKKMFKWLSHNKLNIALLLGVIITFTFISAYFGLSYFNRFAADDYEFYNIYRQYGIIDAISLFYLNWEGAYTAIITNFSFHMFFHHINSPFLTNLSVVLLLCIALYIFMFKAISLITKNKRGNIQLSILLTSIIISSLYYNDLAISETWFWVTGNIAYFIPISLILFAFYLIIDSTKRSHNLLLFILFFIIAGTRLNYAIIVLGILSVLLLFAKNIRPTISFSIVALILGLIIYIIAPGNYLRKSNFDTSYEMVDIISNTFIFSKEFIANYVIKKLHYHLFFSILPAFFIGVIFKDLFRKEQIQKGILIFMLILIPSLLAQALILYISKAHMTARTLPLLSLITTLTISIIFLNLGVRYKRGKAIYILLPISIFIVIILQVRRAYINIPIHKTYSEAYDKRIRHINETKEYYETQNISIDTLYLRPLPSSGWLHNAEIGSHQLNQTLSNNRRLKNYLDVPFTLDLEIQ